MNQEDNIKKFFEKRLQDTNPGEDAWNVPSDDIWNKAKVHFPKKEKKRRPFIYFLFGGSIFTIVVLGLSLYFFNNGTQKIGAEKSTFEIAAQINTTQNNQDVKTTNSNNSKSTATISSEKKVEYLKAEKKEAIKSKTNGESVTHLKSQKSISVDNHESEITNGNHDSGLNSFSEKINAGEVPEVTNSILEEKTIISQSDEASQVHEEKLSNLDKLPVLIFEIKKDDKEESTEMDYKIIKPKRKAHRLEIGLSHSPFILNPKKALHEGEDENEALDIGFKYRNLNLPVSRWFNRKWSMT